ncbi:hypothetical protein EW146_g4595 [Bondarzewia mesenterica]|uniref:NADP-dependent oxidoreductase domain-containing protein n=1 Tax=Bondarzewia mesenterica TaxID=1095465 RepID=A0A4V3XF33_9AGAM|nr:hypothetical protein EW146_g4595 [Bondarzewia mesenterica]
MATPAPKKMPYVRLGNSGLKVSRIILGTMSYGYPKWAEWVLPEEEAIKHVKAAYDAGIQTFDTADVYSNGESEVILGKAIKKLNLPRDEIVVMTKVSSRICFLSGDILTVNPRSSHTIRLNFKLFHAVSKDGTNLVPKQLAYDEEGYVNQHGLSRKHIFDSVKHSLERLQLDYIDVLQCHRFDYHTPIEETMQALHDVVKAGYVRYIGMSSCWAYQFNAMQSYAIAHNLTPFISMQNQYSLIYREEEREMFPTLKHFGVGSIPWSPLARGLLSRPLSEQTKRGSTDAYKEGLGTSEIIDRVEEIAKKRDITMTQVALAWCLAKDGVSAPVVGTTNLENLRDLIDAVHIKLTDEEIKYLEEAYKPVAVIGHI